MSNDKPRLRFIATEIHIVKIMVDRIIILQLLSYRRLFNTHNTAKQQFGTRGLSGAPALLV